MATHDIEMQQTVHLVGNVDVVFIVSTVQEGKLGQLNLSKGGVDWWPRNSKKRYHPCTWEQRRTFLEGLPARKAGAP